MILEWSLILSVTLVSVTMLMIIGAFFAILPQAQQYYSQNRTMVLLLSNSFNIFYIIISPFIFNLLNKHYVKGVLISAVATGAAAIGRYLAAEDYQLCLLMTVIVAIAHIPIITAPYGLLKLFPDWQKSYAASIPLFLPVLGINFCILYGMAFITSDNNAGITTAQVHAEISKLNGIIASVGLVSTISTIILMLALKDKIEDKGNSSDNKQEMKKIGTDQISTSTEVENAPNDLQTVSENKPTGENGIKEMMTVLGSHGKTMLILVAWGSIVGVNWTYGSLFGVIFAGQQLTDKEIALIGLAANLSSAFFSNLGSFIKNRYNLENYVVIEYLNLFGIACACIIQLSRFVDLLQNLYFLIFTIIILRAGFSSFVSLSFVQMEKGGVSSLIISGFFFWVANVINLLGMELVDLVPTDLGLFILTLIVGVCIFLVNRQYSNDCYKI